MKVLEAVRFLLEICLVVALAVAGTAMAWWVAVILSVLFIVTWGWFVAPKSAHRLRDPGRLILECVLFIATGFALGAAGRSALGIVLAIASIGVAVALRRSS